MSQTSTVVFDNKNKKDMLRPFMLQILKEKVTRKNENVMAIFVGPPGSAKSYGGLSSGEHIDPTFGINRVHFTSVDFIKGLKRGKESGEFADSKTHPKVMMYDEMGVGHNSRNFHDVVNKSMNYIAQTFRKENLICFFTVPKLGMIDKTVRDLIHYIFMPIRIDRKKELAYYRAYVVQQNPLLFGESSYLMKPKVIDENGTHEIEEFALPIPSKRLRLEYEEKKELFNNSLYTRTLAAAETAERESLRAIGLGGFK